MALQLKPLEEAKARANSIASGERYGKGSPNSDEPITPIRTDDSLAAMAGVVNTFGGIIGGMKRQSIT